MQLTKAIERGVFMSCMERVVAVTTGCFAMFAGLGILFAENPLVSVYWDIKAPVIRWVGVPLFIWGLWCFVYEIYKGIRDTNSK